MHNVLPNSGAYGYYLARRARRLGVDVRTPRCATRPLVDGERVNGIECTAANGATERCQARGGVVLACGDYSASAEMKTEYASPELARIDPCCNPANTGDGHRMAITLGGRILNSHMAMPLMCFAPPPRKVWVERLPPWRALTKFMELSLDYTPDRLLRPFIMSFLTTILAVSPRLFEFGAILVNKEGRCFGDELDRPVDPACRTAGSGRLHRLRQPSGGEVFGLSELCVDRAVHRIRLRPRLSPQSARHVQSPEISGGTRPQAWHETGTP